MNAMDLAVTKNLYEEDFYTWTQRQAALLRSGRIDQLDLENIAEEIETLGRSELSELRSRYKVLCMHLLKKILQPEKDGRSWTTTIVDQRESIAQLLSDNPGLKPKKAKAFLEAYAHARKVASSETGIQLDDFPENPPFTPEEAESEGFWP
jgi:hypothetical protein